MNYFSSLMIPFCLGLTNMGKQMQRCLYREIWGKSCLNQGCGAVTFLVGSGSGSGSGEAFGEKWLITFNSSK